jgi:hypothetical protein
MVMAMVWLVLIDKCSFLPLLTVHIFFWWELGRVKRNEEVVKELGGRWMDDDCSVLLLACYVYEDSGGCL